MIDREYTAVKVGSGTKLHAGYIWTVTQWYECLCGAGSGHLIVRQKSAIRKVEGEITCERCRQMMLSD